MALIQEFSCLACAIFLLLSLCFLIKIYCITVTNRQPRVEENRPQQRIAAGRRRTTAVRADDENKNNYIQGNRQVPREQDERQGY